MSATFGRALIGESFKQARENGNTMSIQEMEEFLNDEITGYTSFKDSCHYKKIFNEFCHIDCQNDGLMNFIPQGDVIAHFKRWRGYCRTSHGQPYDCPAGVDNYTGEAYQYHSFIHYLIVDKRNANQRHASHIAKLPPAKEEDWASGFNLSWEIAVEQMKFEFRKKFSYHLNQIDQNTEVEDYTDWKFSNGPTSKIDARLREERFRIHLPSMKIPTWFFFHGEDANSIVYKYRHDVGKLATCTIPDGSPSAILYLPKEFGREDQLRGFFNTYQGKINQLNFSEDSGIDSSHGTLIEFDFRRHLSFDLMAKQDFWLQVYKQLTKIMHSASNPRRDALNHITNRIKRHVPRSIRKERSSFKVIWQDQQAASLKFTRDGEMRKISFNGNQGLVGVLFTVAAEEKERMVTITRHYPAPKQASFAYDNGRGVIWIQITGSGNQKFTLQSTEDSSPVLIELNPGQVVEPEAITEIQSGHQFAPEPNLISGLLDSLASDDFSHIDRNLIESIDSLPAKTSESILKEVIRWAYDLAQENDHCYVSNISRKARLAWYLLQQKYLGVENINAMSAITKLLEKMPEFVRLPPEDSDGRWNKWSKRRDFVDLEAMGNNDGRKLFVSSQSYSQLTRSIPNIEQDGHGRRWVLTNEIPSHTPRLNFDHLEHPYTSRFFSSPEQWINQLISLMDNFHGWRNETSFQWFREDEFKTVLWVGARDGNQQKRMIDPTHLFKDFSQIGYQDSMFTRNKRNTQFPYFSIGDRKFSLLFIVKNQGGRFHLEYESFIAEYGENGNIMRRCKFGGSDVHKVPSWVKEEIGNANLWYLVDPLDERYFERETLRSIHLLYLKAIDFRGLNSDGFRFGGKGASSEGLGLFHDDTSNPDDDHIVFSPIYSGNNQEEIKKRYLERLGWWFDEN